jgi:hypothetical protein
MKTMSLFLRFVLGATLIMTPFESDAAKPKKGGGKQRSAAAGQLQQKAAKAPQRSVRQVAPHQQKVVKAPGRQNISKPRPSKPHPQIAQQRRVSPPAKRAKASVSKSEKSFQRASPQRSELRASRPKELASIEEGPRLDRKAKAADSDRLKFDGRTRDLTRGDRKEPQVETAQEQESRAQRVRERERIAPIRKQQIADRQERRRERVERFRENRQNRFAAVQRQRRALRAARLQAQRAYAQEVREEIRDYWEDRADEIRDRIRDRRDYLFDDDWWEHRHWYHGPILVSDPWWWWRPAPWNSINVFINAGWSEPLVYDYGTDVFWDEDDVYVRGEPVGTRVEYSRGVVQLANPTVPAIAEAPVTEQDWRPLGVWALVQEDKGDAIMFFQLSVNRDGIMRGAYTNVVSGEELPIVGRVDRQTQRAAWHIGDNKEKVFEAGLSNLSQDQASCLVHFGNGELQNWLLVRMPEPKLPDKPATLSQISE